MLLVFLEFIQANPSVHALCLKLSSDCAVVVIQASLNAFSERTLSERIIIAGCGGTCPIIIIQ